MHISYNGVPLEIVTLDRVERRSVLTPDQTSVLYVEWAISLSCVYHPSQDGPTTPSGPSGNIGGTSVHFDNPSDRTTRPTFVTSVGRPPKEVSLSFPGDEYPLLTDRELMVRLSIPRRPLIIWAYDISGQPVIWLRSPRVVNGHYMPRDALTGPIVQANIVTATLGNGVSFGVQMEIKTWTPPCPDGSDRLVLAHRWQMAHSQDENNYLTRTTTGEIYFHGTLADEFSIRRDVVAQQLLHPIPLGFRRHLGPVTLSPDGLVLRYMYHDVDQQIVFDAGDSGATVMAIDEVVDYNVPFQGQEILAKWMDRAKTAAAMGSLFGLPGLIAGAALGGNK